MMNDHLVDARIFWTPWEYQVCTDCYDNNPYAIWLVKVRCFQPHRHLQCEHIRVVIDSENMVLEPIRPMPSHFRLFQGPFIMCKNTTCFKGDTCGYAHCQYEADMWNFKKRLERGNRRLVTKLSKYFLDSQSPSEVCQACFEAFPKSIWLAWLKCTNTKQHSSIDKITVVVSGKELVKVRPLPAGVTWLNQVKFCGRYQQNHQNPSSSSSTCQYAHSNGELLYWHWQIARKVIFEKDTLFKQLSDEYSYPDEESQAIYRAINQQLTMDNYYGKYHKLVFLEEMESSRKLIAECDSKDVRVQLDWSTEKEMFDVYLMNLSYTSLDYIASHGMRSNAEVTITLAGGQRYSARIIGTPDFDRNALVLQIPPQSTLFQLCSPPDRQIYDFKASVHFEINHQYYSRLHTGIDEVTDETLAKLFPHCQAISYLPKSQVYSKQDVRKYSLDWRYQLKALNQMLSCSPEAPYLLLGPFGTGKTYLLAAAVAKLIEAGGCRVLVCTHLNRGADSLYRSLKEKCKGLERKAARVVGSYESSKLPKEYVIYPNETVKNFAVLITTFGTALRFVDFIQNRDLSFSHILIDEGAQCPEPEALGAIVLASSQTRITIVGDSKQVGPRTRVFSKKARDNGLGTSLLERLFSHYKAVKNCPLTNTHTSSLLTNYRCHPSILMLASSLFYECALLSRSNRKTHPKAPYPLVFACTSVSQNKISNCQPENEEEARLLITKMIEFIETWKPTPTEPIGLLASTKQQVVCLRKNWRLMKRSCNLHNQLQVEILPTYNIQGEEFSAVFLSTAEPTDDQGAPADRSKSICNEFVFNTVVTRAQSLIFVVGNPFILLRMGSHFKTNCWMEYIRRCIQCQSFELTNDCISDVYNLPKIIGQVCEEVLLSETIQQAEEEEFDVNEVDIIIERYLSDLNDRREYKIATELVQSPSGDLSWVEQKVAEETEDGIVWCHLECNDFCNAIARPVNPNVLEDNVIRLSGANSVSERKGILHGGIVRVDAIRKCVLFDEDTEQALANTHFGESFLCRVDPKNPILFFPLDRRYPKFVNLPILSVRAKSGVVCFDPKSINSSAKVSSFIPLQVATKMLFMVKFLGWRRKYAYPLGIIVAALPPGLSPYTGELILRISNNIPLGSCCVQQTSFTSTCEDHALVSTVTGAFTIDPEGSCDHDDALTCKLVSKSDNKSVYEVGVHITDVQKYIPKDSELDKQASLRGCAAYRSPRHCISYMLPEEMIKNELSMSEGSVRSALSVIIQYSIDTDGTVEVTSESLDFVETKVEITLALTYEEAQMLLFKEFTSELTFSNRGKVTCYNDQRHNLRIEDQLNVLWKIAMFNRQKRMGKDAAYSLVIEDPYDKKWPEAHFLVQELMIWTNNCVAIKLLKTFPEHTILRVQDRLPEKELTDLRSHHSKAMATSLALRGYVAEDQSPVDQFQVLSKIYTGIRECLDSAHIRNLQHCIQFEHLHPQIAVAIVALRQGRKSCGADYVLSTASDHYWHDTLRCAQYTHFTSPIRRYVDIVTQRLLHAAIHGIRSPYTREELKKICCLIREAVKRSNNYDREVKRLDLATNLRSISQHIVSFIQKITENAEVELTFTDPLLKVLYAKERSVPLKHFNALSISSTLEREREHSSIPNSEAEHLVGYSDSPFVWKAKISSFHGTAESFCSNPMFQFVKHDSDFNQNRHAKISLFCVENGIISECSNLIENKIIANIIPFTHVIPGSTWTELQQIIKHGHSDPSYLVNTIKRTFPSDAQFTNHISNPSVVSSPSAMWIYELHRPIKISEVLKVQLTASCREYLLSPSLQLIEVGPELRICANHNSNASECFADKLMGNASKRRYGSTEEYFQCWEQVLLYEAVSECLTDGELQLIKDVSLKWPKLECECDSLGQTSYKLVIPEGQSKAGVLMEIPRNFMILSFEFFTFNVGDLLCIRYDFEENGKTLGFVLHMIVHHIDPDPRNRKKDEPEKINVYLKFVGQSSNFISPKVAELLTSPDVKVPMSCEIQLLPLTLPFRRIYRCLHNIRLDETISPLALEIAMGTAKTRNESNLQHIDSMLTAREASIATSIWPITQRQHGSGRKKLNRWQKEAITLACNNDFTLIQGPPGTGKSVTGAHLAYALAKKLHKEHSSLQSFRLSSRGVKEEQLKPCVMYCGPSNQAVNVVLNYLIQDGVSVKDELKILRVFSKTVEQKEYPGPKLHEGVFPKYTTSEAKCEPNHEPYALHKKIRRINPKIAEMDRQFEELHRQHKIPSIAKVREYRAMVFVTELEVLRSEFDIILCTCNEASSHRIAKSVRPVYCIVDECAMSTEPECMVPIQRAEKVVLIGDHKQLKPVIKNRDAEAKGLGTSLFERYAQGDEEQAPLQKPFMLKRQYRMHEELCKFPSKEFYAGELNTDFSVKFRNSRETRLDTFWPHGARKPFVFVNVEGVESESHTGRKGKARVGLESKYNKQEAKKIAEIATVLVKQHRVSQEKITALTPYSSQKEEIKKRLQEKKLSNISVKTITESQGSESGIILLSTVRSKPRHEISIQGGSSERKNADIGWIRRNLGFVTDRHQICVGLTRCKYGLVIIGNKYLLSYDETWKRLIDHYKQNGCVKDGSSFPY